MAELLVTVGVLGVLFYLTKNNPKSHGVQGARAFEKRPSAQGADVNLPKRYAPLEEANLPPQVYRDGVRDIRSLLFEKATRVDRRTPEQGRYNGSSNTYESYGFRRPA